MKAETFNLINHDVKKALISRIMDIDCDGKVKVVIRNIGNKTTRQHSLDWKWSNEIFNSGIGHGDSSAVVTHARSKWMFCLPLMLAGDNEVFIALHEYFMSKYGHDPEKCIKYAETHIKTKDLSVKEASEYMTNKMNYWLAKGVNLTEPRMEGL